MAAEYTGGGRIPPVMSIRRPRTIAEGLRRAARLLADHWLPRTCALCDRALAPHEHGLCAPCLHALPGIRCARCPGCGLAECGGAQADPAGHAGRCRHGLAEPFAWDRTVVVARYAPPLDRLILALKFRGELAAARPLGLLLADRVATLLRPLPEVLVPVPLAPRRLAERGYNQSQAIAVADGRRLGLPVAPWLLSRVRETPAQSRLPLSRRRENLAGALRGHPAAAGRRVALVDDVMTTGATAHAAALALKQAGARSVVNLAVARTE